MFNFVQIEAFSCAIQALKNEKAYRNNLHGGPVLVLSSLLREFWIIRAQNTVRRIIHNCSRCARFRDRTLENLMGPLQPLD